MTDYTDPESPVADPHAEERLTFVPITSMLLLNVVERCNHCGLTQTEHINSYFCPEWRLRQLDGDR